MNSIETDNLIDPVNPVEPIDPIDQINIKRNIKFLEDKIKNIKILYENNNESCFILIERKSILCIFMTLLKLLNIICLLGIVYVLINSYKIFYKNIEKNMSCISFSYLWKY